ncbi:MAG TPA: hypothetical protein VIZ00_10935 [Streptosporangiaceae bacterium]
MAADDPDSTSTSAPQAAESPQAPPGSPPAAVAEAGSAPASSPGPAAGPGRPAGTGVPGSTEPAQADVVRLLVKAVATLPDAERDQVYAWFLDRGITGSRAAAFAGAGPFPRQLREVSTALLSLQRAGGLPGAQPAGQQVVPVRFAADQHAALRTWCSEHGFSMATVIRGLVSRFLEGQLPARN